ncbi:hypothetical protein [Paraglaciecola sp. 2405UD69-4]|uniref:hypothetical protein n=1 Tax=Paraglaciecola sp. 2405UD69-4 TaxID=3391836 RepID=UPI0039C9928D
MKKLLISAVLCATTLSFTATAALKTSNNLRFVGDTEYASLCEAAATNNIDAFKSDVRQHAFNLGKSQHNMLKLLKSSENFQCDGQSVSEFAQSRGAADVASYISGDYAGQQLASADKYKFVGDSSYKNFCKAAVTNNVQLFKTALSSKVGSLGASRQEVMDTILEADNITCAGQSLTEFFEARGASSVISYIADKVSN